MTKASELVGILEIQALNLQDANNSLQAEVARLLREQDLDEIKIHELQAEVTRLLREAKANNYFNENQRLIREASSDENTIRLLQAENSRIQRQLLDGYTSAEVADLRKTHENDLEELRAGLIHVRTESKAQLNVDLQRHLNNMTAERDTWKKYYTKLFDQNVAAAPHAGSSTDVVTKLRVEIAHWKSLAETHGHHIAAIRSDIATLTHDLNEL